MPRHWTFENLQLFRCITIKVKTTMFKLQFSTLLKMMSKTSSNQLTLNRLPAKKDPAPPPREFCRHNLS